MRISDVQNAMSWFRSLTSEEQVRLVLKLGTRAPQKIAEHWLQHIK